MRCCLLAGAWMSRDGLRGAVQVASLYAAHGVKKGITPISALKNAPQTKQLDVSPREDRALHRRANTLDHAPRSWSGPNVTIFENRSDLSVPGGPGRMPCAPAGDRPRPRPADGTRRVPAALRACPPTVIAAGRPLQSAALMCRRIWRAEMIPVIRPSLRTGMWR